MAPALGRFAVILSGQAAIAIRFVRHTAKGDGGAVYEWAMQEDGSADFTRYSSRRPAGAKSTRTTGGTHLGILAAGQPEVTFGPLTVRWSPFGADADCLYFRSPRPRAISITATEWTDLKGIDVHSPKLTWYHLAETR